VGDCSLYFGAHNIRSKELLACNRMGDGGKLVINLGGRRFEAENIEEFGGMGSVRIRDVSLTYLVWKLDSWGVVC
jgi:hypothetical protein